MTNWREVHSSAIERPTELDTTSSEATLTVTEWVYEQREYTQSEYAAMKSPAVQSIMQAVSGIEMSIAELSLGAE